MREEWNEQRPIVAIFQIHTEHVIENGWVLPTDKTIFAKTDAYIRNRNNSIVSHPTSTTPSPFAVDDEFGKNEFEMGGFMLKRLPVRDGEHGYYRHVVFVSMSDKRTVPLTMGRFEVKTLIIRYVVIIVVTVSGNRNFGIR